jgi:ribonuclease R
MPEIYKERIIKFLKHRDYTPLKLAPLSRALGVRPEDYPQFKQAFEELREAGHVVIGAKSVISLPAMAGQITGTFRANPRGFGFVIPLEPTSHGDLFIPANATGEAMTGDIVTAKVIQKGMREGQARCSGRVIEVLERARNRFVGTLFRHPEGWLVQPDGTGFVEPISVDDVTAKNARAKDKVIVEILTYPTERFLARGVIIEVLGRAGHYDTEIRSIIAHYHLPCEFEEQCLKQARDAAAAYGTGQSVDGPARLRRPGERENITDKVIITIDPPDAKDFDDAISLERDDKSRWVLGVHIADVSHFVPAGTPLDTEAKVRGNSVYLPAKTIPMLPEILSNGICSLQPEQARFVKSVYLTYDDDGKVVSRRFSNSLMRSTQRLTYEQADKALKGRTKGLKPEVVGLLKNMERLSRLIEKRRVKAGMLHLELPEIELVMDKSGRVVDAHPADDSYPHTIIEMFMVEANEAVASILDKANTPIMRRIHPEPNALSLQNLSKLVRAFGYSLPRTPDRHALQALLEAVKDKDCSLAVNMVVLRSLEKARYAPLHVGHFALASTHYCHFTSPIRRYADLLIHRVLDCYLKSRIDSDKHGEILTKHDLAELGTHITFTEERADDAEEELKTVLILQMLTDKIGQTLDCVVSGLAGFGIFVQCRKFGIEGLVRLEDLGPDTWKFDSRTQSVIGLNSGTSIHLGRAMKVRIVSVNVPARQLNVCPDEPLTKLSRRQEFERLHRRPAKKSRHKHAFFHRERKHHHRR